MKRLLLSIILIMTSTFVFTPQLSAVNIFPQCYSSTASNTQVCKTIKSQTNAGTNPILKVLKTVITILSLVIGVGSVIVLMIAGLTFIVSGSDPQSVARARNMLIYAIVGIVVAVLAESLVLFILKTV